MLGVYIVLIMLKVITQNEKKIIIIKITFRLIAITILIRLVMITTNTKLLTMMMTIPRMMIDLKT